MKWNIRAADNAVADKFRYENRLMNESRQPVLHVPGRPKDLARTVRLDRTCPAASSPGEPHPSKLPLTPSSPPTTPRELRGRESPGEVFRSLIESPLAVPEEVFAALPRPRSTYSTAAPSSPCFIRHRRRKARHPPLPDHRVPGCGGSAPERGSRGGLDFCATVIE